MSFGIGSRPAAEVRGKVLAAAANGVQGFIEDMGGDAARILATAGISEAWLDDPTLPLDLRSYVKMMELAASNTQHDNFGLLYGCQFQPAELGLIGHIALASPTLGSAVSNMAAYFKFHQHETDTRLVRDGALLRLEYRITDSSIGCRRQDAELTMGMFINVFRQCLGPEWGPEELHFEHMRPLQSRQHEAMYHSPVYFGQRKNALVFNDHQLTTPMTMSNLTRLTTLQREIVELSGVAGSRSLINEVKSEIRTALAEGYPHIADIADTLKIPRWTLQRRLLDEGCTFSDLVQHVRRELSESYLKQPHTPIVDIAFALGYSELSAFSRAFTRWFDISPQGYRRLHSEGARPSIGRMRSSE